MERQVFKSLKARCADSVHTNFPGSLTRSVIGAAVAEKFRMNCWYQPDIPRNLRNWRTVVGTGKSVIALTLSGSVFSCPLPTIYPKYRISFITNLLFLTFIVRLAFLRRSATIRKQSFEIRRYYEQVINVDENGFLWIAAHHFVHQAALKQWTTRHFKSRFRS